MEGYKCGIKACGLGRSCGDYVRVRRVHFSNNNSLVHRISLQVKGIVCSDHPYFLMCSACVHACVFWKYLHAGLKVEASNVPLITWYDDLLIWSPLSTFGLGVRPPGAIHYISWAKEDTLQAWVKMSLWTCIDLYNRVDWVQLFSCAAFVDTHVGLRDFRHSLSVSVPRLSASINCLS